MNDFTEDNLVQKTMSDYLHEVHKWRVVMAWNQEDFGQKSLLGRTSEKEVVLFRDLLAAIKRLNPDLPDTVYDIAIKKLTAIFGSQSIVRTNQEKYELLLSGVKVKFRQNGEQKTERLRIFDFENPEQNEIQRKSNEGPAKTQRKSNKNSKEHPPKLQ